MKTKAKKSVAEYIGKSWIVEAAGKLRLSTRETELILALLEGVDNASELAEKMSISPITVQNHLANIFRKTGHSTRLEVAIKVLTKAIELKNSGHD